MLVTSSPSLIFSGKVGVYPSGAPLVTKGSNASLSLAANIR